MGFGRHRFAMLLSLASDGCTTLAEANYHGALFGAFPKSGFVFASPKRTFFFSSGHAAGLAFFLELPKRRAFKSVSFFHCTFPPLRLFERNPEFLHGGSTFKSPTSLLLMFGKVRQTNFEGRG